MTITQEMLAAIQDRASLWQFLADELKWPVDRDDTFTYDCPDLQRRTGDRLQVSQLTPFGAEDPWAIMLVEFRTPFRRAEMREILRSIREEVRTKSGYDGRDAGRFLFVCVLPGYAGIRFARFEPREGRQPRLSIFGWDRDDLRATRTLRDENLVALRAILTPSGAINWGAGTWESAWDVEAATRAFFRGYRDAFEGFLPRVEGIPDPIERRNFCQQLFNRLMFCWFLQKKGWLDHRTAYVSELYATACERDRQGHAETGNFYAHWLFPLFFRMLNVAANQRERLPDQARLARDLGRVPFLNGGLFDPLGPYDVEGAVSIENSAFAPILEHFEGYRFTIDESTPDDIDVAVDPEMLGKVFEELVTGRHETGSYYTPRPIVSFMCREALKGYLATACPAEDAATVEAWVDGQDEQAGRLRAPEAVLEALKRVTVCDPACGSGAYLLGMMHELLRLRQSLFAAKTTDHASGHDRKLEIIQRNLYGADLEPFAANVAMLRLWLSMVVDDPRDPLEEQVDVSLPNLRFRILCGDSLRAHVDPVASRLHAAHYEADAAKLRELHDEYYELRAGREGRTKPQVEAEIDWKLTEIARLLGTDSLPGAVRWQVDFAEVFAGSGFDIVIANPPFVRHELIADQKPNLKTVFGDLFCGTADLYTYFYLRGLQLLRPGGMLAFISPNKWFRAAYGEKLRAHFAARARVRGITDFGDLPIFNTATTYPMIFVAQKGKPDGHPTRHTVVRSLAEPYPDVRALVVRDGAPLPDDAIIGAKWTLTDSVTADRLRKMERAGVPLGEYVGGAIYRGVLTGLNAAFVIDGATRDELIAADPRSAELIKPLAAGQDIRRWHIRDRGRWLIFTRHGTNIEEYPAIMRHLAQWRAELTPKTQTGKGGAGRKPGSYKWFEIQDNVSYYEAFEQPKIVFPDIATDQRFALGRPGQFTVNTTYLIPTSDSLLLAVLNSRAALDYYVELSNQIRGGYLRFFRHYLERVPIPVATDSERAPIVALVERCLAAGGEGCAAWEREIDERVAALYGL